MAGSTNEDYGIGGSSSLIEGMSTEQRCYSADSLAEWRSCEQVENGTPSTLPPYWDTDDDDDDCGPKPSELYGKFTWKIENFSQSNKRELRSNAFEVGGYKWYILIYPQGCDVSNHLSLFLCVANHNKLLPGWSHFAQFTIAVVNKDPKKSKYSDTLHRFWKKEHDWGWKKFMELAKVSDGFVVADTLVIKAQVQVIREKAHRPFRCLDRLYRRELVRVYLSNVEQICRRFVEERRGKLSKLIEDKMRWTSFRAFWLGIDLSSRRRMSRDKSEAILKVVVKQFFIEKEVTSTLVMDSLYSGIKALECQSKSKSKKGRAELDLEEIPAPMIRVDKDMFVLADDVLLLLERAAVESLPHQPSPPKDEKGFQTRPKDGGSGEELNKGSIEIDERRLTELGQRTVEIFVLAHIFSSRIEVAYQETVALKRQEELIREEEAAWQVENELRAKRTIAEKEKRARKKQAKQKRNSRKGKDKGRDEKSDALMLDKNHPEIPFSGRILEGYASTQSVIAKIEATEDVSDVSDTGDDAPEAHQAELEDRDTSSISDTSEVHHFVKTSGSERQNGQMEKRNSSVIDDSCSTCSTNLAPPILVNGSYKGNPLPNSKRQSSPIRIKGQQSKDVDNGGSLPSSNATSDADSYGDPQPEHEAVNTLKDKIQKLYRIEKEERIVSLPKKLNIKDPAEVEQHPKSMTSESSSSLFSPAKKLPSSALQSKRTMEKNTSAASNAESVSSKELSSASPSQTEKYVLTVTRPLQTSSISISESQKVTTPGMSSANQNLPAMTRPLSAPLVPSPRPATPVISTVQAVPLLSRSLSAVGRLGTDPSSAPSYIPQSYRNAIMGKTTVGAKSTAFTHTSSTSSGQAAVYSQPPSSFVSSVSMFSQNSARNGPISARPGLPFGSVKTETLHTQQPWGGDYASQEATSSGNYDSNGISRLNIYGNSIGKQYTGVVSSNVTTGQAQGTVSDEFPHIGIINELLDEDQSNVRLYMNHHHGLNRQYTFPRDVSTADIGPLSAPCRNDRADQFYGEGYHRMYGPSNGLNELRDSNLSQMDPSGYVNCHIDGVVQNQWPCNHADLSMLSLGSFGADGYSYQLPDNLNPGYGENGYSMYHPSNRH